MLFELERAEILSRTGQEISELLHLNLSQRVHHLAIDRQQLDYRRPSRCHFGFFRFWYEFADPVVRGWCKQFHIHFRQLFECSLDQWLDFRPIQSSVPASERGNGNGFDLERLDLKN